MSVGWGSTELDWLPFSKEILSERDGAARTLLFWLEMSFIFDVKAIVEIEPLESNQFDSQIAIAYLAVGGKIPEFV